MNRDSDVERPVSRRFITAADVDLLLQTAGNELLDYVHAATDHSAGLLALMDQRMRPADSKPDDFRAQPGGANLAVRVWVAQVKQAVTRGNGFAQSLDAALAHALDVSRASTLARNLVDELGFAVIRTQDLTYLLDKALEDDIDTALGHDIPMILAVARDLDRELSFIRERTTALDGDLDLVGGLSPGFVRGIARARHIARSLAREQEQARDLADLAGNMPIDVSAADLSGLDVDFIDLSVLAGMVWSAATRWPPGVADRLRACSDRVAEGRFRLRVPSPSSQHSDLSGT